MKSEATTFKPPIPSWCKADCKFRDKEATHQPQCQFAFRLEYEIKDKQVTKCLTYRNK